ncbi:PD-(D/E)XK nuclease family protein [Nostoc sp. XA010]|uniref:PDDEXK-like family protein n=1 Tax=Nostoc sp. XA010 TaxID=2780407 RepID=UPI001E4DC825|nr:PD-(D/E)XK nuclease family protein [Nostoc sp. XA010]MCC5660300.1 PD-(D/E)XK nuclease family protein [Nostoc sp. XA010]
MTIPPTERALLESLIVDNEDLEKLELKLAQFNIFEAIGVVRQELRHSNFLAFLLNPSENHRLDDIFLKRFLKRVLLEEYEPTDEKYTKVSPVDIDIADFTDADVRREWQNIDILIHSPRNKLVCAIENKIDAGEGIDKLIKYQRTVKEEFKDCRAILIYLTPVGDPPSQKSWRIYNYSKIAEIIDSICISYKSTLGTDIYTLMTHYSTLIRRHIVSDSEVAELCRKIYTKHKPALDLIFEHRPDLQSEIATRIHEFLNREIDSQKISVYFWAKGCIGIIPKKWEDNKLQLHLQFENYPQDLIIKVLICPNEDKSMREKIHKISQKNIPPFQKKILTPKWTTIYTKSILKPKDYEDADLEELMNKVQEFWRHFIKNDFVTIENIINTNIDEIICKDISVHPES